jgi:hypothetical protein
VDFYSEKEGGEISRGNGNGTGEKEKKTMPAHPFSFVLTRIAALV